MLGRPRWAGRLFWGFTDHGCSMLALSSAQTFVSMRREVVIQWTTRDVGQPIAMVSAVPGGPYTATAAANTTTYLRNDMCGGIAATCAPRSPRLGELSQLTELFQLACVLSHGLAGHRST